MNLSIIFYYHPKPLRNITSLLKSPAFGLKQAYKTYAGCRFLSIIDIFK